MSDRKHRYGKAHKMEPENEQTAAADGQDAQRAGEGEPEAQGVNESTTETLSLEKLNEIQEELDKAREEAASNLEGWKRERAEFTNFRKRVEREQAQMVGNITGEVIKKYLVILDDLDRALKTRPTEGEGAVWAQGVELIYRKLQNILEAEGLTPIPAEGQEFNPEFHEAISHEENPDHESGEIIEVVQQGYRTGDRVIRPALVRVAR